MKDCLLYLGAGSSGFITWIKLGDISNFSIGEKILLGFLIIFISMIGAAVGSIAGKIIDRQIKKIKGKWNGKKNRQKQSSLAH